MLGMRQFAKWRVKPLGWTLAAMAMAAAGFVAVEHPAQIDGLMHAGRQAVVADAHGNRDPMDEKRILRAVEGAKSLRLTTNNPDSFKLASMTIMSSGAVCYVYWSRRETGDRIKAAAVLLGDEIATLETQGFDLRWKDECQGKKGEDATGFGELMVY
jgi:hypothetical protein